MKEIFIEYLKHKVKLYDRFTQIDKNFINQNGNMPLIFQIHWKLKHNNAVQELIREGKGKKLITLDIIVNKCIKRKDL